MQKNRYSRENADALLSSGAVETGVSLVVPICNELPNLEPFLQSAIAALRDLDSPFELILVDDGSTDGTAEALTELSELDDRIVILQHRRRFGKGAALSSGISQARFSKIATIDADLQEDPAELPILLAELDSGLDLVSGCRTNRRDPLLKKICSRVFNWLTRRVGGPPLRDINCGFKILKRELAIELPLQAGRFRLMPLVAHWWGYRVGEVEVTHRQRTAGQSHFGSERFPGALFDLLAVVFLFRYEERPGHPFFQAGSIATALGLVVCGHLGWIKLTEGSLDWRYPRLAFGILLLLVGAQLVATGILGEWLAWRAKGSRNHRLREVRSHPQGQLNYADSVDMKGDSKSFQEENTR